MFRKFKTRQKDRTKYVYFTAEGTRITISADGAGVTQTDIELLHSMDDAELDEQRRYNYRVIAHLDAYHDGGGDGAADRNDYLADESANPEQIHTEAEEEVEHRHTLERLSEAMNHLLPQQKELFRKVYLDQRTNTDIAAEEGVTEAAIRNRLRKMHDKLKKSFRCRGFERS